MLLGAQHARDESRGIGGRLDRLQGVACRQTSTCDPLAFAKICSACQNMSASLHPGCRPDTSHRDADASNCAAQHVVALPGQPLCKRLAYEVVRAADLSESDWPPVLRGIKVLELLLP